jgi:hypothetical protein
LNEIQGGKTNQHFCVIINTALFLSWPSNWPGEHGDAKSETPPDSKAAFCYGRKTKKYKSKKTQKQESGYVKAIHLDNNFISFWLFDKIILSG